MDFHHWVFEITDMMAIICVHIGSYLKIKKRSIGYAFSMTAILYFTLRSAHIGLISQGAGHIVSFSLAAYGFWKWRRDERKGPFHGMKLYRLRKNEND